MCSMDNGKFASIAMDWALLTAFLIYDAPGERRTRRNACTYLSPIHLSLSQSVNIPLCHPFGILQRLGEEYVPDSSPRRKVEVRIVDTEVYTAYERVIRRTWEVGM